MREYQVHPQVNGGLRTLSSVEITIGGVLRLPIGKIMTQEVTDRIY